MQRGHGLTVALMHSEYVTGMVCVTHFESCGKSVYTHACTHISTSWHCFGRRYMKISQILLLNGLKNCCFFHNRKFTVSVFSLFPSLDCLCPIFLGGIRNWQKRDVPLGKGNLPRSLNPLPLELPPSHSQSPALAAATSGAVAGLWLCLVAVLLLLFSWGPLDSGLLRGLFLA